MNADRPDHNRSEPSVRIDAASRAMAALSAVMDRESITHATVLQRLIESTASAVPSAEFAAVTVLMDGAARTAACTHPRALEIDKHQYDAGQGPCLEAATTRTLVRASGAEVAERWPQFASLTSRNAVRSYLSAPVVLDDSVAGALNLYSTDDHGFGELDEAVLTLFVAAVGVALHSVRTVSAVERELDGLHTAMRTRADIEMAKGYLMAVRGCSGEAAFAELSLLSQRENVKLYVVARSIIDSAELGSTMPGA